ncbi:MAG: nucleotidyltransferase domain-containing protein [Caldiserica bacterium]|nr:MAG: nucleotidyltransferase domain-containing protein [Caldisericota bacterium]
MDLTKEVLKKIKKIGKKYKLKLVILFGSILEGKIHSRSDIDIAMDTYENVDFKKYLKILSEFQATFSKRKVDICYIKRADPLILWKISQGKLLYGKRRDFCEFKIYAYKNYIDYFPYFEIEKKQVLNFIRRYAYR